MVKKTVAALISLALVVGLIAVPALAANLDYNDYITDVYVDGDNDVVKVALPYDNAYSVVVEYDDDDPTGSPIASGPGGTISWFATADMFYYIDTYPLGPSMASGDKLDLMNIPDGSVLTVTFSCDLECSGYGTPHHDVWIYYCDASNNVVGSTQNTAGTFVPGDQPAAVSFTLDKPSGAVSLYFCVQVDDLQPNYSGTVTFTLESVDLELSISALYFLQKQTGRTNELLEKVNDQLEEQGKTQQEIKDILEGQLDEEKNQANNQGNSSVGDLENVIPDYSTGFMDSIKQLADAMSYEGTSAVLPIPQVNFPQIGDLIPGFVMMEAKEIEFEEYVDMVPGNILLLVQSLLTCVLIVYCFKELYDTVAYVLTLRRAGGE